MATKQKVQPRCNDWTKNPNYNEKLRQQRDREEKQKKAKFFYKDFEELDKLEDDDNFLEILESIREESGILDVLKWLHAKFEAVKEQRKLNNDSEPTDFCFSPPEDWKNVVEGDPMVKFLEILELEISPSNWCIPAKILDFGLKYKSSLIQDLIDDVILSNFSKCKVCKREFNSLPQHVNKSKSCREKYSDQLSTTALVRRNITKNLENRCFILS